MFVSSIVTPCDVSVNLQTTHPDAYDLVLGQRWEQALADHLTALGLPAYRPSQFFISARDHQLDRKGGSCWFKLRTNISECFKPELLRPYQRDVLVKLDKVRRMSVEVKALCPAAFNAVYIQVGCCPKWDEKRFKVDALVLINQETGEAFVVAVNHDYEASGWVRQPSCRGRSNEVCWAVPRKSLKPLAEWVEKMKS